jgi:hypothetical protein
VHRIDAVAGVVMLPFRKNKALTLRLEVCVDKLFSKHQNAFINGINIIDGVLPLRELIHHAYVKKASWYHSKNRH